MTRRIFGARRRSRWRRRLAIGVAVVMLAVAGWTVAVARRPGNEDFVAKSADWFRDHHLATVANWVETTYYNHEAPSSGGVPSRAIPDPATTVPPTTQAAGPPPITMPPSVAPIALPPIGNEGTWLPVVTARNGNVGIAEAQMRPDAQHTSVLGALVWMNPQVVSFREVPGTVEPGGAWNTVGTIGGPDRNYLVAAFNGGFRLKDSRGGFYTEGRDAQPLVNGAASLVVRNDGTVDVGQWGRDDILGADVASVRQNLILMVDGGKAVADVNSTDTSRWGRSLRNQVLVWRSGIGVRPDGTLVYAASNGLTVATLADMFVRAGCVRAMELDINPEWVTYNLFTHPNPAQLDLIYGQKLLPDMHRPAERYLGADSRDFTAVLLRH